MRRIAIKLAAIGLTLFFLAQTPIPVSAQTVQVVGIPTQRMDTLAAEQQNTHWCWAAAIQTALNTYGVKFSQDQIVRRSYGTDALGNLPDWSASFDLITQNLTGWEMDQNGTPCHLTCQRGFGAPPPAELIAALQQGHPVILAITEPGGGGHAIVCTAASYVPSATGPCVLSMVVRDPWPRPDWDQTKGRGEYPAALLASHITGYWIVNVEQTKSSTTTAAFIKTPTRWYPS